MAAAVSAAPVYPFPASKRTAADWWKSAAPIPLVNPEIGRLSFGWDADALYLHLGDAAQAGTVSLQLTAGERRLMWKNGNGRVVDAGSGKDMPATVSFTNNGTRNIDVAIRWADLGIRPGAGRAVPLSLSWGINGEPSRWLPEPPILVNPLSWGAVYLNETTPFERCAPTLTRPFVFRFDPTHGRPALTVGPEPVAGLCVPVEIVESAFGASGATDAVLRTQQMAGGRARFDLPAPAGAAAVGITLRVPLFTGAGVENEYRSLPRGQVLEKYRGAPGWNEPEDWDGYWSRARADLARTPMNARLSEVKDGATATGRLYRVELDSLDNVTIVCWYYVPKDVDVTAPEAASRFPAAQIMPGYGAEEPPIDRTAEGYITLSVNPRGHGPSNAFWRLPDDHLNWNIQDPEKYYYRGAYMDCVRGMQFLMGRPEVDARRVGVEGSSQGGAFALATAALDQRVAACSANVPFLCDFPSGVRLCTRGGLAGMRSRFEAQSPEGEAMRRTVSYIDASFMAGHISCPTLIAVGQMDRTCPPAGGVAAYNRLPERTEKSLMIVPNRDHEVMPEWRTASDAWFARYLKG